MRQGDPLAVRRLTLKDIGRRAHGSFFSGTFN